MSALQLGPLAVPLAPVVLAVAAALGLAVGKRLGRRVGVDAEPALLRMFLLGLLAARLGFVWEWRGVYLHEPWSILDIRDGGWEPMAGFAVVCLYGLVLLKRLPVLRKPIMGAALALLVSWTAGEVAIATLTVGARQPMPTLSLQTLDGGSVTLASFVGKPTVVNLWATWCPPCRREMPLLQQAQAAHSELNFVFVNQGETREDVVRYLQGQGIALRNVLLDARRATGAAFNEQAMPTTLFFDAQGRLVSTRVGALSAATLAQRLDAFRDAGHAPGLR
ncbi:MAG: TlpA family protein disulfide reductase [Variovorax sp.]|nr:TlpA family protein disulfide reductase [Variovorax sp.]